MMLKTIPVRVIKFKTDFKGELNLIAGIIKKSLSNNEVKNYLVNVVLSGSKFIIPDRTTAEKILLWVQENIKYVPDIEGIEQLYYPEHIIRNRFGDCDDFVILLGTWYKMIGYKTGLVSIDFLGTKEYNHIYLVIEVGNDEYEYIDGTALDKPLGFQTDQFTSQYIKWI